jgi:ribokinase
MPRNSRIIVVGSINTDLVIRGPRLPGPGETVIGGEFFQAAGGKGANQAVAAARAALDPVTFVGAVGDDDLGRSALALLRSENLNCEYVKTIPGVPSGVALILVDEKGQNLISVASGANARLSPDDIDGIPEEILRSARVFLTCLETPIETVVRGLKRAKQSGLLTILNPAPATCDIVDRSFLELVDVLTPNEGEAALLTDGRARRSEDSDQRLIATARTVQELGCKSVMVTRGSAGCLVVEREICHVPGHEVRAVDATAAGDGFNGALAVALAEGKSLGEAARWANAAAAISVTRLGAQPSLPGRREIIDFLATRLPQGTNV